MLIRKSPFLHPENPSFPWYGFSHFPWYRLKGQVPGDILDCTKIDGPAWLDLRSSGDLIGTPERKAIGVNRFVVQVNDNKGGVNQVVVKINVQAGRCDPTPTIPYSRIDNGLWQRTGVVTLKEGQTVVLGPQPISGGTWTWSGPHGFEADRREIELSKIQPDQAGAYTAIYTNECGAESRQIFNITLSH